MAQSAHVTFNFREPGEFGDGATVRVVLPPTPLELLSLASLPREEALVLAALSGAANDRAIRDRETADGNR